jgi:serine/threonine protein kinase
MTFPRSIASRADANALLQILGLLEQFEEAWKRGEPVPLEDLLREITETGREELLWQALGVELDYRRRRGESPNREEYLRRFPTDARVVHGVFDEPTVTYTAESSLDTSGEVIPERLGKFQVLGRLGSGGQGSALLARDLDLGRLVVLKRFHASAGSARDNGALCDGQALSRLRSRYVPHCYGIEPVGAELVMVMEYVPGRNLFEATKSGRLGQKAAARMIEQVAEGLEAVHACGLVHRDIKPANIVVGEDHLPRLVDFGLAAHLGSVALRCITGTPPYMAPEQARGQWELIDGRTDIYGLGAVLYALLTGQPPHPGQTTEESLKHARTGVVTPLRALNRSVPRDLERIAMKALESDPALRYATVSELRQALRQRRLSRRYRPVGLVGAFLLAAAAVCYFVIPPSPDPVKNQEVHSLTASPQPIVKVDRGGQELSLEDAVPLVSGDRLWIECDLPAGWKASAFWFDTEGNLTELSPIRIVTGKTVDRLYCPPDDAISLAGPHGTELIVICARPSSRIGKAEVAALLPIGNPLSVLNSSTVAWVGHEHVTLANTLTSRLRGPGALSPSSVREALQSIQEVRQRLGSRIEYLVGVAFAHTEPEGSTGEDQAHIGASSGISSADEKGTP